MSNPNQLFLLADHIKLSLLERQRAISLNLEPNSQDGHISRSLESMREGLEGVTNERERLEQSGDSMYELAPSPTISVTNIQLERQASSEKLNRIFKNNITTSHHNSMASRAVRHHPAFWSLMILASPMTSRGPQNDLVWHHPHHSLKSHFEAAQHWRPQSQSDSLTRQISNLLMLGRRPPGQRCFLIEMTQLRALLTRMVLITSKFMPITRRSLQNRMSSSIDSARVFAGKVNYRSRLGMS
jgi:hypothetical protein